MKKIISILLMLVILVTLVGCNTSTQNGVDGKDGADGKTPYIENGYWYIDGVSTGVKAEGVDGTNGTDGKDGTNGNDGIDGEDGADGLTPYIGENGNWWIGDQDTNVKAEGVDGTNGTDGKDGTNGKDGIDGEDGADGLTPYIGENGNWWIGDQDTNVKAEGVDGTNGTTPTIEISSDGYWIINGKKAEYKAVLDPCAHSTYSDWNVVAVVSCTSVGVRTRACKDCGAKDYEITAASGHAFGERIVAATCAKEGYTLHECSNCEYSYCDDYTEVSDAHSYTDFIIISNCAEYKILRTCTVCNKALIAEQTPVIAHNIVDRICTECGYIKYSEGLKYGSIIDSYVVMGIGDCTDEDIWIPPTYKGKAVTGFSWGAFENCASLRSITIPDSVTEIKYEAFKNCTNLVNIRIPNSVTEIGDEAFYGCISLEKIIIPESVTSIGYDTFLNCSSLTSVEFKNTEEWSVWDFGVTIEFIAELSSEELSDPFIAAQFLRDDYSNHCWERDSQYISWQCE